MNENNDINAMNENIGIINYIMMGRIYDLLVIIGDALGKSQEVLDIMELHRQGHLMSPLPSLIDEESQ